MAFFVRGKACRVDGTCWELQALADNYQISLVLSSIWVEITGWIWSGHCEMGMMSKAGAEHQDSVAGLILTKDRVPNAPKMCSHFFPG